MEGTIAVFAALPQRERTGEGQHIDVAMAATLMAINEHAHMDLNRLHPGDDPAVLGATDGSFFTGPNGEQFLSAISLVNTVTFNWFVAAMRRQDLIDDPNAASASLEARSNVLAVSASRATTRHPPTTTRNRLEHHRIVAGASTPARSRPPLARDIRATVARSNREA
jgi:crotonobetainyl-CoA:carnitine CoA-transferase CaiB-like acyl-CoA transferase